MQREVVALGAAHPDWEIRVLHVDTIGHTWRYLTGMWQVVRETSKFRPDLVHVHYGLTQIITLPWRGPIVVTFHGSDVAIPWQRWLSRAFLRRQARPIVVGQHMGASLGARGRDAEVIACGVDTNVFAPATDAVATGSPPVDANRLILGFPSSPSRPVKDYALFQETVAELVGGGSSVDVRVFEGVDPGDVPNLLRSLSCLVMTSWREGSPVITREALCCGTRVVSVDVGDVRDQIAGLSGCEVVGERSATALAEAVKRVASREVPDSRVASTRFALEAEAERVARVYQRAIEGRAR